MEHRKQRLETQIHPFCLVCIALIFINNVFCSNYSGNETKSGKFIFDDEAPVYNIPDQKARNVVDPETDIDEPPPELPESPESPERASANVGDSECPVEGGVVFTRWGTVSLGAVVAGLAAGMLPQNVPVENLVPSTSGVASLPPDVRGSTINNRFASTLVGKDRFQFLD